MIRLVLLPIFFLLSSSGDRAASVMTVEHVYDVFIGSKFVGELSAVRKQQADSVIYLVTSEIDAQVGIKIVQEYRLESVYRNGTLDRSDLVNVVNEKVRADTKIIRDGKNYIALKEDSSTLDIAPVDYSIARMFFTEPEGLGRVFSENFAEELECAEQENERFSKYCLYLPDRTRIDYYYKQGICEEFEVRLILFNVRYSLRKVNSLP